MCTWLKIKGGACRAAAARWPAPRLETGAPRRRPISIHRLRRFAPPKYPPGPRGLDSQRLRRSGLQAGRWLGRVLLPEM